ncbi:hypothetical protein HELRODRAFT_185280 [Helobdella robusta]|uniref:CSN12-like protein n=1 Tax=Helobdella robusta TaxID=6412 RepID=T1FML7_HELRO|nr:hypothetical protein HELRODRAFT_185280 [Helobdella robusta]ESO10814.1 hypothetical protein HELRODRAFT_185280 [Helobdella robusta]
MAQISLNTYLQKFESAFENRDGDNVAVLLSFRDPHISNVRLQLEKPETECEKWFGPPLDEIVAGHLKCCWAAANHDFIEAYNCQYIVMQAFSKLFQSQKEENWALPILYTLSLDLRVFAANADVQLMKKNKGKPGETLEKAAEVLMGCFRICASDNRAQLEDSKKWGMMSLINQLFKIYFKINKLHLCKPLVRAIDSSPLKDRFSVAQMVAYRYHVGRKAIFDSDYKTAEDYLTYAFQKCHKRSKKNKKLILIYLLPVKMLLGHMPKMSLLQKYNLMQFAVLSKAVIQGNLKLLTESLKSNEGYFIRSGIYLILEKLKIITYRNLIKKVALLMKVHQLPISAFTAAFKWMGEDEMDDEEMQCIIANLIYEDRIKGYLSYQHKKLVVSKQNAFPSMPAKIKT